MSLNQETEGYPLAQFRKTYFEECTELLDALQSNLDRLLNGSGDEETLHAIFRSVHSIKGGAGAFGFAGLVAFSHVFESLLDAMREQKVSAAPEIVQLLLRASDSLTDIVNAARTEQALGVDFAADSVAAMEEVLAGTSDAPAAEFLKQHPKSAVSDAFVSRSRHTPRCCRRLTSLCCWSVSCAGWVV
jgi:two-component system chemotaxis sensor kinase CheA